MSERRIDTGNVFPSRLTRDGIDPGMEFEETVFGPISREDIVRYAEASGDDNPIHQDEEYARKSGAPTVFAMGMLPAGYLATAVSGWFGGPQNIRRFKVRFTTRVWPGDEIVCRARVVSIEDGLVKVALEASRRGAGPEELNLPEEQNALLGEADIELPE
ncbi:MAG: MaoC family dehydratase N-terminal domain-containing protein [Actinomycetota bacterium]|nr:MaoC family dehydratase N-terminal domain-containing protein [Actinomycetota bacterium]